MGTVADCLAAWRQRSQGLPRQRQGLPRAGVEQGRLLPPSSP